MGSPAAAPTVIPEGMNSDGVACETDKAESDSNASDILTKAVPFRIVDPLDWLLEVGMPTAERHYWLLFSISIFVIGLCTYVMVDATNRAGIILYVPPTVMGLTFLAAGTSIPDAMGSIAVAKQGEGDMAVANALGSNVFDILIGLGLPWTIRCAYSPNQVVFGNEFMNLIVDVVVLLFFVGSLFWNKWYLTFRVGQTLIGFYIVYCLYNLIAVITFRSP